MKISQTEKLYHLLKDGKPHSTLNILENVYGSSHLGIARISGRIFDAKKKYGVEIKSFRDEKNPTIYHYQLLPKGQLL